MIVKLFSSGVDYLADPYMVVKDSEMADGYLKMLE
jgi:hypothetical protein